MTQRLKELYKEKAIPNLIAEHQYTNPQQVPKVVKIQINRGLGLAAQNNNILKKSIEEFWIKNDKPEKLLFSYHGIPKKYLDKGDRRRKPTGRNIFKSISWCLALIIFVFLIITLVFSK